MTPSTPSDSIRDAAVKLIASGNRLDVTEADAIVLRSYDANEENPWMVEFVPIGSVLGIRTFRQDAPPADRDTGMIYVSMRAFVGILGALGIVVGPGVSISTSYFASKGGGG